MAGSAQSQTLPGGRRISEDSHRELLEDLDWGAFVYGEGAGPTGRDESFTGEFIYWGRGGAHMA